MSESVSKKFGGQDRANKARKAMSKIFSDPNHPLYLEKDIDLSHKYDVSRITIYKIREEIGVPARTERILSKLSGIDTEQYTKKELSDILGLKYPNLYKIIREYNIKVKPDIAPIQSMIKFQREKIKEVVEKKISTKSASKKPPVSKCPAKNK